MDLIERTEWLLLGCAIGFIVGYIVRGLRDIKEELEEVEQDVKHLRDEKGIMSHRWTANIALFVVVCLTLYAAVMSQVASNTSNRTSNRMIDLQSSQQLNLACTTQVLNDAIQALGDRSAYSTAQVDANIDLQQAQFDLITQGQDPDLTPADKQALFDAYVEQIKNFLSIARKNRDQLQTHPFPTPDALTECLVKPLG